MAGDKLSSCDWRVCDIHTANRPALESNEFDFAHIDSL